jgi:hypothetical protein
MKNFVYSVKKFLQELFFINHCDRTPGEGLQFVFTLPGNITIRASNMITVMNDNQSVALKVLGFRTGQAPFALPTGDVPVITSSDPAVISIGLDADGVTAVAKAMGVAGTATITATADGFTDSASITVLLRPLAGILLESGTLQDNA